MKGIGSIYHDEYLLELELIIACSFIALFAILLILLTFIKRGQKIRKAKEAEGYQVVIDNLSYKILFEDNSLKETLAVYNTYKHKKIFNKLLLKELVMQHNNYVGESKQRIEHFYKESGLYKFSVKRLDSYQWIKKVESIRDLSKLNYQEAYEKIFQLTYYKQNAVQKEAIIGAVILRDISELGKFRNRDIYLDDWMQSHFLYSLKIKQWDIAKLDDNLFDSKNETFQLLVARIIELYQLRFYYDKIAEMISNCQNKKIKSDLKRILVRIT